MILYLIMGLMFAFGVFTDVDYRDGILEQYTYLQTILIFVLFVLFFPFFIGARLSELEGDELREQERENE